MGSTVKVVLRKLLLLGFLVLSVTAVVMWRQKHPAQSVSSGQSQSSVTNPGSTDPGQNPVFDKLQYSINDPSSVWAVVNKGRVLPADYSPSDLTSVNVRTFYKSTSDDSKLRKVAADAAQNMFNSAASQGISLVLYSGYRSYAKQSVVYRNYVGASGAIEADKFSARPGYSEHQTGLAVDFTDAGGKCNVDVCFANTNEGKWLASNAHMYGFIMRYQNAKDTLTGYQYEPWHFRYVGFDLASQIYISDKTLEQFFGLPVFKDYPSNSYNLSTGR